MKTCSKCGEQKDVTEFYSKGTACKECRKEESRLYREANKKKCAASKAEYYKANRKAIIDYQHKHRTENHEAILEKGKGYNKTYYGKNKAKVNEKTKAYYHDNKEMYTKLRAESRKANPGRDAETRLKRIAKNPDKEKARYKIAEGKRRAAVLKATPRWADEEEIKKIYVSSPKGYHVDHIVPLRSKTVCGLHCEHNLIAILAKENMQKSNKF